jgi:ABC-type transport system involved in cytochrome bd biosynthesis fused ATPase/permease subunit
MTDLVDMLEAFGARREIARAVVIAHRLFTVRTCDRIITIERGPPGRGRNPRRALPLAAATPRSGDVT